MSLSHPTRLVPFEVTQKNNWVSRSLNLICDQPVQPSYNDYTDLQKALCKGDDPMDVVIQWVMQDIKVRRAYFETALFEGIEHLPEPYPVLVSFFQTVEQKPDWVDDAKLQRAVDFTHQLGINNGFILRDLSLMSGYLFPGFNQPLILTGALKQQVGTRLAETTKWWVDVTEPEGLKRMGCGFTSTIYVRFIHALVRHQLAKSSRWDKNVWGAPINQFDLAMTNVAFSNVVLLGVRALGILPSKQEVDDFLHFWRYVGWLMGVEERWQIHKESDAWRYIYWLQFTHPESDASSAALGASLSKEPFEREYAYFRPLQQKLAYRQHLEITQFFIGKKRMKNLGLPHRSAAWFAYYLIIRNLILYTGAKGLPSLKQHLQKNGRQMQKMGLNLYTNKAKRLASMHQ